MGEVAARLDKQVVPAPLTVTDGRDELTDAEYVAWAGGELGLRAGLPVWVDDGALREWASIIRRRDVCRTRIGHARRHRARIPSARMGGGAWVWVAVAAFVAGTVLWLIHVGFRLTVVVSTSRGVEAGDPVPDWYLPLWHWGNTLLAAYVLLASIGLIALGAAALAAVVFPAWTAWASIGMGVAFIVALAAARNTMPVLPHLGTGLMGIVALVEAIGGG